MSNVDIVSLDDFLDSFEFTGKFKDKSYSPRDMYNAYTDFESGNYISLTSLAKNYGLLKSTCYSWKNEGKIPICVKHIKSLDNIDLLPLTNSSNNFHFFKELFLYTLLSGYIYETSENNYSFELCGSSKGVDLNKVSNKISEIIGLDYKLNRKVNFSSPDNLTGALSRLLYLTGIPLGDKKDWEVMIPDWVDTNSFIYYACKLKGVYSHNKITGFCLWSTDNDNAIKSADNVIKFLSKSSFSLKKNINKDYRNNKYIHLTVTSSQQPFLELFLKNYKPILPV